MSSYPDLNTKLEIADIPESPQEEVKPSTSSTMSGDRPKRAGRKPGRRSTKMDVRAKLERSRQSARECRARKKMRYQYLEDLVANREKAVFALRNELEMYKQWCLQVDKGLLPLMLLSICQEEIQKEQELKINETDVQKSSLHRPENVAENMIKQNGTSLAMSEQEVKAFDLTQRKEMDKTEFLKGATGGPEDYVMSQSTLNLDDILALLSTGENTVFGREDGKHTKGDGSGEDGRHAKGDNSRDAWHHTKECDSGEERTHSKGDHSSIPSLFRHIANGDNYCVNENRDVSDHEDVSARTTKLSTIVEEPE